jgi:hypothetical protein
MKKKTHIIGQPSTYPNKQALKNATIGPNPPFTAGKLNQKTSSLSLPGAPLLKTSVPGFQILLTAFFGFSCCGSLFSLALRCIACFSLVALFPCVATKGGLASFVSPVVSLSFPRVRSSHLCFAVRCLACFGLLVWIAGKKYL